MLFRSAPRGHVFNSPLTQIPFKGIYGSYKIPRYTGEDEADKVVYGWDVPWEGTEALMGREKELGQTWLKEARGYYDRAKKKRIKKERERGDRRMMRECRNILKLIGAAHGIGNMEDKRCLKS